MRRKGLLRLEAPARRQALGPSSGRDPARRLRTSRSPALTAEPCGPLCSLWPLGIRNAGSGEAAPDGLAPASWPRYVSSPPTPGYNWLNSRRGGPRMLIDSRGRRARNAEPRGEASVVGAVRAKGRFASARQGVIQLQPCGPSSSQLGTGFSRLRT